MKILSERLLILRKEKQISQPQAAKELNISFPSYCRYEHDEREPNAPVIVAMAKFFGVSSDYLLGLSDER